MKIKLDKDYMVNELGLPESTLLEEITDTSRWSVHYRIVFPYQGRFLKLSIARAPLKVSMRALGNMKIKWIVMKWN